MNRKILQFLNRLSKSLCSCLHRCHHPHPVPGHGVYHHVENFGVQRVTLGHPTVSLEGRSEVAYSLCRHLQPIPVCLQDPERPGIHAVSCQDVNAPVPIQGINISSLILIPGKNPTSFFVSSASRVHPPPVLTRDNPTDMPPQC